MGRGRGRARAPPRRAGRGGRGGEATAASTPPRGDGNLPGRTRRGVVLVSVRVARGARGGVGRRSRRGRGRGARGGRGGVARVREAPHRRARGPDAKVPRAPGREDTLGGRRRRLDLRARDDPKRRRRRRQRRRRRRRRPKKTYFDARVVQGRRFGLRVAAVVVLPRGARAGGDARRGVPDRRFETRRVPRIARRAGRVSGRGVRGRVAGEAWVRVRARFASAPPGVPHASIRRRRRGERRRSGLDGGRAAGGARRVPAQGARDQARGARGVIRERARSVRGQDGAVQRLGAAAADALANRVRRRRRAPSHGRVRPVRRGGAGRDRGRAPRPRAPARGRGGANPGRERRRRRGGDDGGEEKKARRRRRRRGGGRADSSADSSADSNASAAPRPADARLRRRARGRPVVRVAQGGRGRARWVPRERRRVRRRPRRRRDPRRLRRRLRQRRRRKGETVRKRVLGGGEFWEETPSFRGGRGRRRGGC